MTIVVVGASLAGLRAVETLRRDGYDGRVAVVGDEPHQPYDRPPLSKQMLAGEYPIERLMLSTEERLSELDVDWHLGVRATRLEVDRRAVTLDNGDEVVGFDGVVIATGARCRTLPGMPELDGLFTLRNLDDCRAIGAAFDAAPSRVVVVGAGFIGAEVAATARDRGLDVTMVEAAAVPLERAIGAAMGGVCAEIHVEHGVDLRLGVGVDAIEGENRVSGISLSDGSTIEADVVVVGVGVRPNTEWLEDSGLTLDDGVVCDETTLTADGIVAAGDVARWPNRRFDEVMRIEHWDNAVEMGVHAARRLLGSVEPFQPVPWFWSDQYDRKIQLAGRPRPDDDFLIVTGAVEERRFAGIYGRDGALTGILGFNRPRHVMQYRQLITDGASWDDAIAFSEG